MPIQDFPPYFLLFSSIFLYSPLDCLSSSLQICILLALTPPILSQFDGDPAQCCHAVLSGPFLSSKTNRICPGGSQRSSVLHSHSLGCCIQMHFFCSLARSRHTLKVKTLRANLRACFDCVRVHPAVRDEHVRKVALGNTQGWKGKHGLGKTDAFRRTRTLIDVQFDINALLFKAFWLGVPPGHRIKSLIIARIISPSCNIYNFSRTYALPYCSCTCAELASSIRHQLYTNKFPPRHFFLHSSPAA